jgi:Domain of unknown function (DUF4291)
VLDDVCLFPYHFSNPAVIAAIPAIVFLNLYLLPMNIHTDNVMLLDQRYRSGYSTKDAGQARILALKMRHQDFRTLLSRASLSHGPSRSQSHEKPVRVQWDPERDAALNVLPYRSIQIGVGGELVRQWVNEWIVAIEDVTERALQLKEFLEGKQRSVDLVELAGRGLVPEERIYDIPVELKAILAMEMGEEGKASGI